MSRSMSELFLPFDIMTCDETGVYGILHKATQQWYVGAALVSFKKRIYTHLSVDGDAQKLRTAVLSYGPLTDPHTWSIGVLELCPREHVLKREAHWIELLDSSVLGFNGQNGRPRHRRTTQVSFRLDTELVCRLEQESKRRKDVGIVPYTMTSVLEELLRTLPELCLPDHPSTP